MAKGPSLGWDIHPKMVWCVDRASADPPDPWAATLFGHARLFQGSLGSRLLVDGKICAWGVVKADYDNPDTAPTSGGSAVSLALMVFGAISKAIEHAGPSLIRIPDQRVATMLTER